MKISVIGDIPEESDSFMNLIDVFIKDHKVGTPVILSAGTVSTLHLMDKYSRGKGYDSVILGNVLPLAVLNADKVVVIWDGTSKKFQEVLDTCKREKKAYIEIKTA